MPLSISVIKKYVPALSSAVSPSLYHLVGLGMRKPAGGGPAGSAARRMDVENAAAAMRGRCGCCWEERRSRESADVVVGRVRASIVSGCMVCVV